MSGQLVNLKKSTILFWKNVEQHVRQDVISCLNMKAGNFGNRYWECLYIYEGRRWESFNF